MELGEGMNMAVPNSYMNAMRLGALLLVCSSGALRAQVVQTATAFGAASCIDRIPPSAFTRVAVYAHAHFDDKVSAAFAQSGDNFLQELVDRVQRQLGAAPGKLPVGEPAVTWRGAEDWLYLVAHKDGGIVIAAHDSIKPGSSASLFARAMDSVSTIGQLEWSADSARDSVRFHIAFDWPLLDSAGHVSKPSIDAPAIPVFSILMPWQRQVRMKPNQTTPRYPNGDARRYKATILLTFTVDSTGHVIPSSVHDLWPNDKPRPTGPDSIAYQSFLEETERTAINIEFYPAIIGGCRVNQLVQMPFEYKLR